MARRINTSDILWMRIAAESQPKPIWLGDFDDDCTAHWASIILRAECMDHGVWWWAASLAEGNLEIASSNDSDIPVASGKEARSAAERAARDFLRPNRP